MSSFFGVGTDLIVRTLKDQVVDWKEGSGFDVIHLRDVNFDPLYITRRSIGFLDYVTTFDGIVDIVPREKMKKAYISTYRRLKPLECEARIKGFVFKKVRFSSRPHLKNLKEYIPEFEPNPLLAETLNNNDLLVKLVKKLVPYEMIISLWSVSFFEQFGIGSEKDYLEIEQRSYNDPRMISWIVRMSAPLNRILGVRATLLNTIKVIDIISSILRGLTVQENQECT